MHERPTLAKLHAQPTRFLHYRTHSAPTHCATTWQIVEVMLEEELEDPELLIEDLKAGGSTPGPRLQRLAKASGEAETEVSGALVLRQSLAR